MNLDQLRTACRAVAFGYFVYDAAVERQKPDLERESSYMDRNWEQSIEQLKSSISDYHAASDAILLAGLFNRLTAVDAAHRIPALAPLLTDAAANDARALQLIDTTQLGNVEFVEAGLGKTPEQLASLQDPLLQLVINLYPTYLANRESDKAREGRLSQLYGSLIEVKQQFLATSFVPDANGTLRFTSGTVRRYSPEDAVIKTPITTLSGVIDKTTGIDPFITPSAVIEKYQAREFGQFRHEKLDDVPVAILYDTDTTGGNSGSPIFNGRGELVGVNFDRCFEATINDFAWDQSYSRSIGVDIRYVLWITGIVYGADHLLQEMGVR